MTYLAATFFGPDNKPSTFSSTLFDKLYHFAHEVRPRSLQSCSTVGQAIALFFKLLPYASPLSLAHACRPPAASPCPTGPTPTALPQWVSRVAPAYLRDLCRVGSEQLMVLPVINRSA